MQKVVSMFGQEIPYTYYRSQYHYQVQHDLPELKDALLIHVLDNAHTLIWYRGMRIDFEGDPFWGNVEAKVRPSLGFPKGILFAFHRPPQDLKVRFKEILEALANDTPVRTCVVGICNYAREMGIMDRKFVRATSLVRYLMTLPEVERQEIGLEIIGLGVEPDKTYAEAEKAELSYLSQRARDLVKSWAKLIRLLLR